MGDKVDKKTTSTVDGEGEDVLTENIGNGDVDFLCFRREMNEYIFERENHIVFNEEIIHIGG